MLAPVGPATAALDPWVAITEVDEARGRASSYLFGYAAAHHRLGGLSWMVTGQVAIFDARRATTVSGTIYALGRRIYAPEEIDDPEGQAAFRALVLREADEAERAWLQARKIARHLDLPLPSPDDAARFLADNAALYAARLARTAAAGTA